MNILIAGGTGFIGRFLVEHYLKENHQITVLSRSIKKINKLFAETVTAVNWDTFESKGPEILKMQDLLLNLAGAGIADKRWTKSRKREIIESRTLTTQKIVNACIALGNNCPPLFNASAVGIYGTQEPVPTGLPPPLDETQKIDFDHPVDFSSKVTRLWEEKTHIARDHGIRVVNMRFGVVLGKNGGALAKMVMPFKFYLGGKIGSGKQPFSWISIVDLKRAIDFLFQHKEINGPVNIVSPHCVSQSELAAQIGKVLNKPSIMTTPALILRLAFGEMADELLLKGQHVFPKVLLDHGFKFQHPHIQLTLSNAL